MSNDDFDDDLRLPVLLGDSGGDASWQTDAAERFCNLPCVAEIAIMNGQGKGAAWHTERASEAYVSVFWITPDTSRAAVASIGSFMTYANDSITALVGVDPRCEDAKELRTILLDVGRDAHMNAHECSTKIYKSLPELLDAAEKQILFEADGFGPVGEEFEALFRECEELPPE